MSLHELQPCLAAVLRGLSGSLLLFVLLLCTMTAILTEEGPELQCHSGATHPETILPAVAARIWPYWCRRFMFIDTAAVTPRLKTAQSGHHWVIVMVGHSKCPSKAKEKHILQAFLGQQQAKNAGAALQCEADCALWTSEDQPMSLNMACDMTPAVWRLYVHGNMPSCDPAAYIKASGACTPAYTLENRDIP